MFIEERGDIWYMVYLLAEENVCEKNIQGRPLNI